MRRLYQEIWTTRRTIGHDDPAGAFCRGVFEVDVDTDKIDDAVLALLYLTLHNGASAWKGHHWGAMDRLHRKLGMRSLEQIHHLVEPGLHARLVDAG
jgi:hypothetical protein